MASPVLGYAEVPSRNQRRPRRRLRIRFHEGAWRLSEDYTDRIGGIFTSLSAAVTFARGELQGESGAVVIDLDGAVFVEEPGRGHDLGEP